MGSGAVKGVKEELEQVSNEDLVAGLGALQAMDRQRVLAAVEIPLKSSEHAVSAEYVESVEYAESETDDEEIPPSLSASLGASLDADPLEGGTSSEEEDEVFAPDRARTDVGPPLDLPFGRLHEKELRRPRPSAPSLGLVADVQFGAGLGDRRGRWYDSTLSTFAGTIQEFNKRGCVGMILLGDQIDMRDHNGDSAAKKMFDTASNFHARDSIGMVLGNHDAKRSRLFADARRQGGGAPIPAAFCYEFYQAGEDGSRWHFFALDPYSCLRPGTPDSEIDARFKSKMDGAIGPAQLQWLRLRLEDAQNRGANVALLSHVALHWRNGTRTTRCVKNATEVRNLLKLYSCMKLVFAGHAHGGAYHRDTTGVHHVTLRACLSTPPGGKTGVVLRLFADRAELTFLAHPHDPLCCKFSSSATFDKMTSPSKREFCKKDRSKSKTFLSWQWENAGSWETFSDPEQRELNKAYANRRECKKNILPNTNYKIHWGRLTAMDMRSHQLYQIRCMPRGEAKHVAPPKVERAMSSFLCSSPGCGMQAEKGYHFCCKTCARTPGWHNANCVGAYPGPSIGTTYSSTDTRKISSDANLVCGFVHSSTGTTHSSMDSRVDCTGIALCASNCGKLAEPPYTHCCRTCRDTPGRHGKRCHGTVLTAEQQLELAGYK